MTAEQNGSIDSLISVRSLTCTFDSKRAIDDVELTIGGNRITAICGLSGSGKSTLLSILGLTRPRRHKGQVLLNLPASRDSEPTLADYAQLTGVQETSLRNQRFGFILQSSYLMPTLSARANVELPLLLQNHTAEQRRTAYDGLLKAVTSLSVLENDLATEDHKLPENLSGGQKQRFGILRALIHDPSVVFADEPCANLDPANRSLVMELLLAWKDGQLNSDSSNDQRSLILVSHDADSVVRYADDIAVLQKGKLVGNRLLNRKRDLPADDHAAAEMLTGLITGTLELPANSIPEKLAETSEHSSQTNVSAFHAKAGRRLPLAAAHDIARSGLNCNAHYRWVTLFIVMTISFVCAAWFLTTGLLNGGELVSEHRLKHRPLARRLLLGDERTSLPPEHIHALTETLSAAVAVDAVSPFRVLDWQFHVPADEADTTGKKGRTINMTRTGAVQREILRRPSESESSESSPVSADATKSTEAADADSAPAADDELHPLLKGLKLAVDRRNALTGKDAGQGIILCPRMMHRMFGNVPINESTVPKTVQFDLQDPRLKRNGRMELNVLGATAQDPPELVYFLCPEDYAQQLIGNVVMHSVRIGPLTNRDADGTPGKPVLTTAEWDFAVQDTWKRVQEEHGFLFDDGALAAEVDFRHNCLELSLKDGEWDRGDWQIFRDTLKKNAEQPESCLADIDDATPPSRTLLALGTSSCEQCYHMVGIYLDDIYAMPAAVDAIKDDALLQGEVDRVIAELVKQLRSFSESRTIVLSSVKWILAITCFVCLLIIQILRAARKRPEAAMLRVIGYSRADLFRLVLCDAAILWILGAVLGILIGAVAGWGTASQHYADTIERRLAFPFLWSEVLSVGILSLLIVLASGVIAAFASWMQGAPADLFE